MINKGVGKEIGTQGNPELIIHSINIELMRSRDWEKINAKYLDISKKLQMVGAQSIVICANTPHVVYDHVQPQIDIPILHIAEATGKEAKRLGLKRLGLLGNRPTMTGPFISGYLAEHFDIQTLIPEGNNLDRANHFVSTELTQGKFTEAAKMFFLKEIERLRQRGAEGIILGCTELPLLIKPVEVSLPTLATTQLHAQMAVDFILEST
jgi:aspartate racemase